MKNFAVLEGGRVTNVVVMDDPSHVQTWPEGVTCHEVPDDMPVQIGWSLTESGFTAPPAPPEEPMTADQARAKRDALLSGSDWTQLADVPTATKTKWAAYRQALRDVPAQAGFPASVLWPVVPD